jgi:membrane protease YdiL (CAAX protease family)
MMPKSPRVPRLVRSALWDVHTPPLQEPDEVVKRRRIVVIATLMLGAALLCISLAIVPPGDPTFYWFALALATVWIGGGLLSGPLRLGRIRVGRELRRPVITSVALGVVIGGGFVLAALVTREIPVLREVADNVLSRARLGSMPLILFVTVVNGIGEEVFFRGALFSALNRNRVFLTTAIYTVVTIATLNVMLVLAAAALGWVLSLQRRASGGVLAPMLTHVTWSSIMLFALPPLFK